MTEPAAVPAAATTPNLYDFAPRNLPDVLRGIVSPEYRIKQIAAWIYEKGVGSFDEMRNIPKETRETLAARFSVSQPIVKGRTTPADDGSQKYLFMLDDRSLVEAVHIPMRDRTTICLSSQAGCAVGCTFCVTGFFGAGRNILPHEILGQFNVIRNEKKFPAEKLNVVFMGMGEPLLNFEHVETTLESLYAILSPRRVTLSTSGIIPGIEQLAALPTRPNLAVSINAPDRKRREEIMPITKKYPLDELMNALRRFPLEAKRDITIEYVLLAGYNDSTADARALARLIRGIHAKVNLIPFNPDPNLPAWMKRPTDAAIDDFAEELVRNHVPITVRRSKGRDIAAACGQLRGKTERRRGASGRSPVRIPSRDDRAAGRPYEFDLTGATTRKRSSASLMITGVVETNSPSA